MLKALRVFGASRVAFSGDNKFYFSSGKCYELGRLDGKLAIVTGASAGIGKETAAELARRGANVIMACRNIDKAESAKADILSLYGKGQPTTLTKNVVNAKVKECLTPVLPEQLDIKKLDLSSLASVRDFAQRICQKDTKLDILINNAGTFSFRYATTEDGFEIQIGTNYLGPFLLTELLLPAVKRAGNGARIIFLSSTAHLQTKTSLIPLNLDKAGYNPLQSYSRSKLANAMYAHYLSKSLASFGILTASVHPGAVHTEMFRVIPFFSYIPNILTRPLLKTPWEGAQTTLYTVLTPKLTSGAYFADCAEAKALPIVYDAAAAEELVSASHRAVGLS
ncbi:hypothetical protein Aperf_G00000008108 [Anoplocephala perfoliata]